MHTALEQQRRGIYSIAEGGIRPGSTSVTVRRKASWTNCFLVWHRIKLYKGDMYTYSSEVCVQAPAPILCKLCDDQSPLLQLSVPALPPKLTQ